MVLDVCLSDAFA
ncbi:hypothetical protein ONZ02_003540 [Vibrio cholerae]|nr:hypothetical protein [Vibrio cholerae]EII5643641.1 hypothetical protein [Vibrio cholerae]EJL6296652.1 hypothetical protein [Vibrio cholerae]EJL6428125.1 hypothetical protein [Vibrio cholerae]EJL6449337.1 hypothetical protein [Vibrio cholerae]